MKIQIRRCALAVWAAAGWVFMAGVAEAIPVTGTSIGAWNEDSVVPVGVNTYYEIRNRDEEVEGVEGQRARLRFGSKVGANQPTPDPTIRRNGLLYEGAGSNLNPDAGNFPNDLLPWEAVGAESIVMVGTMHYYDNTNGQDAGTLIEYAELDIMVHAPTASALFTYGFDIVPIDSNVQRTYWSLLTGDTFGFAYLGYWHEFEMLGFSLVGSVAAFDPATDVLSNFSVKDAISSTPSNYDLFLYARVTQTRLVPDGGTTTVLLGTALLGLGLLRKRL